MNQYRRNNNAPSTQRIFVMFSVLFVIAVAVILISNSRFEAVPPVNSDVSTPESSYTASDITQNSEPEVSEVSTEVSDITTVTQPDVSDIPDISTCSDASNAWTPSVDPDLPYDPASYLELRKEDILPTELDGYFKDSVFIGNSLVVHFYNFYGVMRATDKNFLGGAKFFCSSAFSARLELGDNMKYSPTYRGEAMHTWDAVKAIGAKTVYYNLMGLNELGLYQYSKTPELTFENNRKVLEKIMEVNPGVKIVVLSNTYMVEAFNGEDKGLNNYNISKLNNLALDWCTANGYDFIDISTPFLDGNVMNLEYCRDPIPGKGCGCHIKDMYYPSWAAMLRNYAYQKLNGSWKNPESMEILAAGKKNNQVAASLSRFRF